MVRSCFLPWKDIETRLRVNWPHWIDYLSFTPYLEQKAAVESKYALYHESPTIDSTKSLLRQLLGTLQSTYGYNHIDPMDADLYFDDPCITTVDHDILLRKELFAAPPFDDLVTFLHTVREALYAHFVVTIFRGTLETSCVAELRNDADINWTHIENTLR